MALDKSLKSKSSKKKDKKDKKKKHKIKRVIIEPADNGGFMVRHEHHPDDSGDGGGGGPMDMQNTPPDETHALGDSDQLASHIQDTFGGGSPGPQAAGPGAAAAPPQGMQTGG